MQKKCDVYEKDFLYAEAHDTRKGDTDWFSKDGDVNHGPVRVSSGGEDAAAVAVVMMVKRRVRTCVWRGLLTREPSRA